MGRLLISQAALAALWVLMAAWHAQLIEQNRPIKHGWWGALSGMLIAGALIWVWPDLSLWGRVAYLAAQACSRLVIFNVLLNIFRGLKWDHTSPTTTSILDQLEQRVFGGRVWLLEVLLAGAFFILQLFIYDNH